MAENEREQWEIKSIWHTALVDAWENNRAPHTFKGYYGQKDMVTMLATDVPTNVTASSYKLHECRVPAYFPNDGMVQGIRTVRLEAFGYALERKIAADSEWRSKSLMHHVVDEMVDEMALKVWGNHGK